MYEELARSQRKSPLEWVVLNVVIPSFALTLLLQPFEMGCELIQPFPEGRLREEISYEVIPVVTPPEHVVPPVLVSIRRPDYPPGLRQAGTEGRVVLRAVVGARGRVRRASLEVLQSTDSRFDAAARQALGSAVFWPARPANEAWVTMAITFDLLQE